MHHLKGIRYKISTKVTIRIKNWPENIKNFSFTHQGPFEW